MKNSEYKRAILQYERGKDIANKTSAIIGIMALLLIITLIVLYPEFVIEVFNNEPPE